MGRLKSEVWFVDGYPYIERRLAEWAAWMHIHAEGLGWATSNQESAGIHASTGHSDPCFWQVWRVIRPFGQAREMETDSVLREMPSLWRKLVQEGYLGEYGGLVTLAAKMKMDRRIVAHHFRALYEEISIRLQERRHQKSADYAA